VLTLGLLLELNEELREVFDFVVYVLFSFVVLFASEGRGMLQVDATILAVEVGHT